jgi:hypothetical protein
LIIDDQLEGMSENFTSHYASAILQAEDRAVISSPAFKFTRAAAGRRRRRGRLSSLAAAGWHRDGPVTVGDSDHDARGFKLAQAERTVTSQSVVTVGNHVSHRAVTNVTVAAGDRDRACQAGPEVTGVH